MLEEKQHQDRGQCIVAKLNSVIKSWGQDMFGLDQKT